jgi:hypothetical protein
VGHEDYGQGAALLETGEIGLEPEARDLVERGERLVHEEHARLRHEGSREGHAHAHSPRELARVGALESLEADVSNGLADAACRLAAARARQHER